MNREISLVGSLIWLVEVTWALGQRENLEWWIDDDWCINLTYFLYMCGVCLSCISTLSAVVSNLVLHQIPQEHFGTYMLQAGNRLQRLAGICFILGFWFLFFAGFLMAFATLVSP